MAKGVSRVVFWMGCSSAKQPAGRVHPVSCRWREDGVVIYSACSSNRPGQLVFARETLPSKSALNFSRMSELTLR